MSSCSSFLLQGQARHADWLPRAGWLMEWGMSNAGAWGCPKRVPEGRACEWGDVPLPCPPSTAGSSGQASLHLQGHPKSHTQGHQAFFPPGEAAFSWHWVMRDPLALAL